MNSHLQKTTWAQRLKRVFGIDIETCSACGGAVRIVACIEDAEAIEQLLTHLDKKAADPQADGGRHVSATPARFVRLTGMTPRRLFVAATSSAAMVAAALGAGVSAKSAPASLSQRWMGMP